MRKYDIKELVEMITYFDSRIGMQAFDVNGNLVIIYEDHRNILNVLMYLYKRGIINRVNPPDIISFDYHDDCLKGSTLPEIESIMGKTIDNARLRDFQMFVEYEMSALDNDWVTVGMEIGLLNRYVNVGGKDVNNINCYNGKYKTSDEKIHDMIYLDHLEYEFSADGTFLQNTDQAKIVRDVFGVNENGVHSFNKFVLLDFDLDCFACQVSTKQEIFTPWSENTFKGMYQGFYDDCVNKFMKMMIDKSIVVTICTEPKYCSGYENSIKLLGYLNKYFFDNKLDV